MIIVYMRGGIGNQLFQYAAARRLAHKNNTELKIDKTYFEHMKLNDYALDLFNINASVATPEDVRLMKKLRQGTPIGDEKKSSVDEVLNWPDDVYLFGFWGNERYFADIADILHKELTLRHPLGAAAQRWQQKISAAECSVSFHVRHGDFVYSPEHKNDDDCAILPPDYYRECVERLKQEHPKLTVFVFSNDLQWCKKNLRFGISTEFVAGEDLTDVEELYLMSLCRHNVIANSTFSWWGAWLNQNPDKKVFVPISSSIVGTKKTYRGFSAERDENSPLDSERWIRVPVDMTKQRNIDMRPYFSLLLVVNDDAAALPETLGTIFNQDYKFYELIIIDNASVDAGEKICRHAAKIFDNVTLIKLHDRISNGAAWNLALDAAQGDSVIFLKGGDRIVPYALSFLYLANEYVVSNVVSTVTWLREDDRGAINISGKKFSQVTDETFRTLKEPVRMKFDKRTILRLLASNERTPLGAGVFKRKFLLDNAIRFNERTDDAELLFLVNALSLAGELFFVPHIFYVEPKI